MKKQTRQVFGQYETRVGQLNDTDNVAKTFSVTPSVQQKLENKMQESSEFLSKVNIIGAKATAKITPGAPVTITRDNCRAKR